MSTKQMTKTPKAISNETVKARDVLKIGYMDIQQQYPNKINVVYDDGNVVVSSKRALIYSWFIWEFHRRYPILPLLHSHHVDHVLNGHQLSSNTHIDLLGRIHKEMILQHGYDSYEQKEELLSLIYQITNDLYNELQKLSGRHVSTLSILDILELSEDYKILELKAKVQPTAQSIEDFYAASHKIILEDPRFKNNNLVKFIKKKILNMNQVNQCILARGFPIEVTGTILSTAIMTNYASGLYKLYDFIGDSRGAGKHYYAAEAPLQDTEYFARRLQLAGMVVEGIVKGDCGTQRYNAWMVKPPTYTSSGRLASRGDLKDMKGKMYLDETTGQLKEIMGREEHLYGKVIQVRSPLTCQEPNQHKICSTCFGMLHHNVSRFANLGHLCDATLTQQSTQATLGTKHLIGSAVGTEILLKPDAQRYLTFFYNTMSFNMKPMNKTSSYKMIVNRNTAIGLTDLKSLKSIQQITSRRITSLTEIVIKETLPNGAEVSIPVQIEQNKRFGYFSHDFLSYLKEKGWTTNEYDHFVFDLNDWNYKLPMIRVPDMEYSYSDHADQIASLIESNTKKLQNRAQAHAPAQVLQELFDLVNSKIQVNMALLEVMIYAVMTPSVENYGMARNDPNAGLHVSRFVIQNRSLAPAYAYENQFSTIANPRSFFKENRPSSPIDVFIAPQQVVEELKAKRELGLDPYTYKVNESV